MVKNVSLFLLVFTLDLQRSTPVVVPICVFLCNRFLDLQVVHATGFVISNTSSCTDFWGSSILLCWLITIKCFVSIWGSPLYMCWLITIKCFCIFVWGPTVIVCIIPVKFTPVSFQITRQFYVIRCCWYRFLYVIRCCCQGFVWGPAQIVWLTGCVVGLILGLTGCVVQVLLYWFLWGAPPILGLIGVVKGRFVGVVVLISVGRPTYFGAYRCC